MFTIPDSINGTKLSKSDKALLAQLEIFDHPETVKNPFSGESVELEPIAVAVYDLVKGAEILAGRTTGSASADHAKSMRRGLDFFAKFYPSEYMTLLD